MPHSRARRAVIRSRTHCLSHWVRSRRMRMHDFNRRLMEMATKVRGEDGAEVLLQRKHELMDILEQVVSDLEREKVSQDEFEHFSFTWQAVDALVRDRLLIASGLVANGSEEQA